MAAVCGGKRDDDDDGEDEIMAKLFPRLAGKEGSDAISLSHFSVRLNAYQHSY